MIKAFESLDVVIKFLVICLSVVDVLILSASIVLVILFLNKDNGIIFRAIYLLLSIICFVIFIFTLYYLYSYLISL